MFVKKRNLWIVAGAGISIQFPSSVPLWNQIKEETIGATLAILADADRTKWRNAPDRYAFDSLHETLSGLLFPELVMESLANAFGREAVAERLLQVMTPSFHKPIPNVNHNSIAKLAISGQLTGVITTNFDRLIEVAMEEWGVAYQVFVNDFEPGYDGISIVKVHGCVSDVSSLQFMRREYFRGLDRAFTDRLIDAIGKCELLICGYSGNDVDLFPVIAEVIRRGDRLATTVVDIAPAHESRFGSFESVAYVQKCSSLYLANRAGLELGSEFNDDPISSSLLPSADLFSCVLFIADLFLSSKHQLPRAHLLFFLAQDIAEDRRDAAGMATALFGKSMCSFRARHALFGEDNNFWGETDFGSARVLLDGALKGSHLPRTLIAEIRRSLGLLRRRATKKKYRATVLSENVESGARYRPRSRSEWYDLLNWDLRARLDVGLAAIRASRIAKGADDRDELITITRELGKGLKEWHRIGEALAVCHDAFSLPQVYLSLFHALGKEVSGSSDAQAALEACLELSRSLGFFHEFVGCASLLRAKGVNLDSEVELQYEQAIEICGITKADIAAFVERRGQKFNLKLAQYKAPSGPGGDPNRLFRVGHLMGMAGVEIAVEDYAVHAESPISAILARAPRSCVAGWKALVPTERNGELGFLMDPDVNLNTTQERDYWIGQLDK